MFPKSEAKFCIIDNQQKIWLKYTHETLKNVQQASQNDVKCLERILAKIQTLNYVICAIFATFTY